MLQAYEGYLEKEHVYPLTKESEMKARLEWLNRIETAIEGCSDEPPFVLPPQEFMKPDVIVKL